MNYILHSVERIIADIGNPLQCVIRTNQNDMSKLYLKGNFDLKQQLLSLSISSKPPEIIKNKIQVYQTRISILLNILEKKECHCNSKCEIFEICKQDIIGPIMIDLCELLKFIYDHYTPAFNLDLNAPEKVYKHYANIIAKSPIIVENKRTKNENYKIITEPLINFIKHRRDKYTYQDIKYIMKLAETFEEILCPSLAFENMFDLCIIYNINSPGIYQFIIQKFKYVNKKHKTNALKIKYYDYMLNWLDTIDCLCNIGIRANKDSLKHSLVMWLKKEYNLFKYDMHITELNPQTVQENSCEYLPKIKTNLSVPQLACLIKLFVENKVFLTGDKPEGIKQYANMFASKNSDDLSEKNFSNKFSGKDEASLKYIKNIFIKIIKSIEL